METDGSNSDAAAAPLSAAMGPLGRDVSATGNVLTESETTSQLAQLGMDDVQMGAHIAAGIAVAAHAGTPKLSSAVGVGGSAAGAGVSKSRNSKAKAKAKATFAGQDLTLIGQLLDSHLAAAAGSATGSGGGHGAAAQRAKKVGVVVDSLRMTIAEAAMKGLMK